MNTISFGINTYGVKEASLKFYTKGLNQLSDLEVLELIIIEQSPFRLNPIRNRKRLDKEVKRILDLYSQQNK